MMTSNVKTMAVLIAHPGKQAELRKLLDGMIGPSRSEPGNLRYDLWADHTQHGVLVLDELYAIQMLRRRIGLPRISSIISRISAPSPSAGRSTLPRSRSPEGKEPDNGAPG